jgi:hypothetical protein
VEHSTNQNRFKMPVKYAGEIKKNVVFYKGDRDEDTK